MSVVPQVAWRTYGMTPELQRPHPGASQAVIEFTNSGSFNKTSLAQFQEYLDLPATKVCATYCTRTRGTKGMMFTRGMLCVGVGWLGGPRGGALLHPERRRDGANVGHSVHPWLGAQCQCQCNAAWCPAQVVDVVCATLRSQAPTWYWTSSNWMYEFATTFAAAADAPLVASMSFAWYDSSQCSSAFSSARLCCHCCLLGMPTLRVCQNRWMPNAPPVKRRRPTLRRWTWSL